MPVSRRRRIGRRISIYLRRFDPGEDRQLGVRVPAGTPVYGRHFALIGVALLVAGTVVVAGAGHVHDHVLLAAILWFGALLFLAIGRHPDRWL
jgi:hypothetical protein